MALLAAEPPPHLGVTVLQLEGLEQAAVTILVGLLGELPGEVRLLPVPESETSGI